MTQRKDQVFKKKRKKIIPFNFNKEVADVFDDMVTRSIPFYDEIHKIILDLAGKIQKKNILIYDYGCSTGTTIVLLEKFFKKEKINAHFIGIDNSQAMLERCREKLQFHRVRSYTLLCEDLSSFTPGAHDFAIMNYTLQFIPVEHRPLLLRRIYKALQKNAFFLLSEKIKVPHKEMSCLTTDLYYDFKRRNGYSDLEISQKREALEKILIPLSTEEQINLLKKSGLKKCEQIFRWYNFSSFLGIK